MSTKGEQALSFLKKISFPRVSGSAKEREAAELILEEIKEIGFEGKKEFFTLTRQFPVKAEFSLISPENISYTVTGMIDAGTTGEEGIDADFYYMEHVDAASLKKAFGKFVLLNELPKEKTYQKLAEAGIAGFLLVNGTIRDTLENSDLDTLRFRENWMRYGKVPAFVIRISDALDLLKHKPERVHFALMQEERTFTSQNLVVTIEGTDLKKEQLAIGAHYDSTEFSYGSWDNGAGVVQLLAILRHLAQNPPRRTVHAIFFGSEEVGLKGSRAFLEAHPELQGELLAMINMDVGGSYLGSDMVVVTAHEQALHYIEGLLRESGHSARCHSDILSSDSAVFSDYGIPAIALGRCPVKGGGYMHTRYDTIDLISADVLEEEIRFLLYLTDRLVLAEIFPIARYIPEKLRKRIMEYFGVGLSHTETVIEFLEEPETEAFTFPAR